MRKARKRKHNPHIPAHIDQAALPAAVYFDQRNEGVWYTLHRDETGTQRRRNIAPAGVSLAELHQIMDEVSNVDRGTLRYVCAQFHDSDRYKKLSSKTHDDYCYSRDVLLNIPTKLGKPLGDLAVRKFTSALVQRIVDRLADEGTPSKAAHALRYLRRVLQWGRNRGFLEVNPALGIEAPVERKQRRLPNHQVMDTLIDRAIARGRLQRNEKGGCPEYLGYVMELAYLCRLRGIEVVTLTDENELESGILTNRRKGSRDNIVRWTPRLRRVWENAKAYRAKIWAKRKTAIPIMPSRRNIIVASHGGPLRKSSLDTAWQRFITLAIADEIITPEQRFALHDLKRRGITDTTGNRADKQEASGHRDPKMMDVYDLSIPTVSPSAD
ncbi:integrase [Pseudomonas protegens]|uniref:site-specific integrase n=1 Tax=Pseudomonas protegens TaxID=380021 RepID=UPI000806F6B2|nr:integrase [Pseudomonas protegens]OBZ22467.1 integrase [Pseudomonas protegens]OKK41284.1 integrase [Pseudomonas protegens]OKK43357.1 integrase [Pseudomonas protegens]OKK55381.1 integrase [Pseudomonas protegens]OKK60819.1 integrase [Pseudomonas protegens]